MKARQLTRACNSLKKIQTYPLTLKLNESNLSNLTKKSATSVKYIEEDLRNRFSHTSSTRMHQTEAAYMGH